MDVFGVNGVFGSLWQFLEVFGGFLVVFEGFWWLFEGFLVVFGSFWRVLMPP